MVGFIWGVGGGEGGSISPLSEHTEPVTIAWHVKQVCVHSRTHVNAKILFWQEFCTKCMSPTFRVNREDSDAVGFPWWEKQPKFPMGEKNNNKKTH